MLEMICTIIHSQVILSILSSKSVSVREWLANKLKGINNSHPWTYHCVFHLQYTMKMLALYTLDLYQIIAFELPCGNMFKQNWRWFSAISERQSALKRV